VNTQFPLLLSLKQTASLDNYIQEGNAQALSEVAKCTQTKSGKYLYLWGSSETGKTHLVTAAAKQADSNGLTSAFIPLSKAENLSPEMLDDIEHMELVCLDDLHTIAGKQAWEEALFHLFNRVKEQGTNLIVTSDCSPSNLQINLPDLTSRLTSGISYRLTTLNDSAKIYFLTDKAKERGMELSPETASYILKNYSRNIGALLELLDQLDRASLSAQRKLTIPFVRNLITPQQI
jgi:DnaA family protein